MGEYQNKSFKHNIQRIADALERLAPAPPTRPNFSTADAFIWQSTPDQLTAVSHIDRLDIDLLTSIDNARDILLDNTRQFAQGFSANNALLWGARGMGKSSLIKAVHGALRKEGHTLILIEILRNELNSIGALLNILRTETKRFLLFCDDLSFAQDDLHYKALKAILEGGIAGRPENVLFYATSNRRHLLRRDMIENEQSTAIMPSEAVEEKVSLSDRFGLWLGFHGCSQDDYLKMIDNYCKEYELKISSAVLHKKAIEWQITRGARSGRVAWQFFVDLAGKHGLTLKVGA